MSGNSAPFASDDLVFVIGAGGDAGNENLPDAAVDALAHLRAAPVPLVEVADDGDAPGVRRPDGEMRSFDALMRQQMRAEPFIELLMRAFDEQIIVHRAEHRREGVRIGEGPVAAPFDARSR